MDGSVIAKKHQEVNLIETETSLKTILRTIKHNWHQLHPSLSSFFFQCVGFQLLQHSDLCLPRSYSVTGRQRGNCAAHYAPLGFFYWISAEAALGFYMSMVGITEGSLTLTASWSRCHLNTDQNNTCISTWTPALDVQVHPYVTQKCARARHLSVMLTHGSGQ